MKRAPGDLAYVRTTPARLDRRDYRSGYETTYSEVVQVRMTAEMRRAIEERAALVARPDGRVGVPTSAIVRLAVRNYLAFAGIVVDEAAVVSEPTGARKRRVRRRAVTRAEEGSE